jgi:tellurite resistance protein TehA-like permease
VPPVHRPRSRDRVASGRPPTRKALITWEAAGHAVRDLDPGYFALVMASGIVSQAMRLDGAGILSAALLAVAVAGFVVLAAASAGRLLAWRARFRADLLDPARSFAFFTFTAACDILAARLAGDGHALVAACLLAAGGAAWLVLGIVVPLALVRWAGPPPALARANGSWFLWAVATASVTVAATSLPALRTPAGAALAVACWAVAVMLYPLTCALVTASLLRYRREPADLTPPYWIFMGASAICTLAGAQLLRLPASPLTAGVRPLVSGLSVVLWAFGTWLIPVLIATGAWRHLRHRVPLRYETGLWSIVFPAGMDAVASRGLGRALGVSWLARWGGIEAWFALAAWLAVALGLAGASRRMFGAAGPGKSHHDTNGTLAARRWAGVDGHGQHEERGTGDGSTP